MPEPVSTVVLLEGASDVAAVRALAGARGADLSRVQLVDLGGVTNVRRGLHRALADRPGAAVLGLCDAGEVRFVERALAEIGFAVRDASDLPAYGFFVCQADLEDELIRALGADLVVEVIGQQGEGTLLETFQQQPHQRERPLHDQLHRFCGTKSGRKARLAAALAEAMPLDRVPGPLSGVLAFTLVGGR